MEAELLKIMGVLAPLIAGIVGVGIGWGRAKEQLKMEREERLKLATVLTALREGGEGGSPLYMPRIECVVFRDRCQDDRCREIAKFQETLAEHAHDIRAFRNFAFWFLSFKEKLPLSEVTRILEQ